MTNKIIRCVFNADLRCSHEGLSEMLKLDFNIDTAKLSDGEYAICVNSAKTIVKIYAGGNTIAHYKSPRGRIDMRTLALIPKHFNGRALNYEDALEELLRKEIR